MSWDAHKLLFQTYGLGIVLVRDRRNLERSFTSVPDYLVDVRGDVQRVNPCDLGIELTREPRGLRLWYSLQVLGREGIANRIEWAFCLASRVQETIEAIPDWEITSHPSMGIITFRFAPDGFSRDVIDGMNQDISLENLSRGHSTVYTTTVNGDKVLRMATTNPETTFADIDSTLDLLDSIARAKLQAAAETQ